MRVIIGNLLKGLIFGTPFWISFMGVLLSSFAIALFHKLKFSLLFTSIMSAIAHSLGQVLMVMYLYHQVNIISLLPLLCISAIGTGILTGILAQMCLKRVKYD